MWLKGRSIRLSLMLALTMGMLLTELSVGFITNATSLIADSFHMLSDMLSLVIALVSTYMATKSSTKNTYGWVRAEILGALTNAVFLVALCLSIFIEAAKRLFIIESIHNPRLLLIVGAVGLVVNLVGLFLFHEHGHSSNKHPRKSSERYVAGGTLSSMKYYEEEDIGVIPSTQQAIDDIACEYESKQDDVQRIQLNPHSYSPVKDQLGFASPTAKHDDHLNMKAVFLHVLGDALGSIVVIVSAIVVLLCGNTAWTPYVDPGLSLVMVCIILATTIPLLRETALILLQTVPTHIDLPSLRSQLLREVPGIIGIHEFHVWQLAGTRIIATAHIRCQDFNNYMAVAQQIKDYFHKKGIHSTTIQPECMSSRVRSTSCLVKCNEVEDCKEKGCCIQPTDQAKLM